MLAPVNDESEITVSSTDAKVRFRKPGWCPKMDVTQNGNVYTLHFDMAPRIVHRSTENIAADANTMRNALLNVLIARGNDRKQFSSPCPEPLIALC